MNDPKKSNALALIPISEVSIMAEAVAKSRMFGVQNPEQAIALMLLCQAEGIHPALALRRYHIIEGKPAMRADAMLGEFQARGGGVIWHVRTDAMVAATFFADKKKIDVEATERAKNRCQAIIDDDQKTVIENSAIGEETVIRTIEDCDKKKVSMSYDKEKKEWRKKWNWQQSPRQMLTARVISEAVRVIDPGLIAGIYTEDEVIQSVEAEHVELLPHKYTRAELDEMIAERNAIIKTGKTPDPELLGKIADAKLDVEETETETNPEVTVSEHASKPAKTAPPAKRTPKQPQSTEKPAETPPAPANEPKPPKSEASKGTETADWQSHVITAINLRDFNGRRLDDLNEEELNRLRVMWLEKYPDKIAANPAKSELAKYLRKAIEAKCTPAS